MNIIQIAPKLPPVIDGIGDYALKLAEKLQNEGITTHFLVLKHQLHLDKINNFSVSEIETKTPNSFISALPQNVDKIILHYSDFPYDEKYASPFWLLQSLVAAKQQRKIQLLVMFHEFPAVPTLTKKLYLFPWQSFVAWRLAEIADVIFTNNSVVQNAIAKKLQRPVTNIPVFSNIGEPEYLPSLEMRTRRILVFGTPARRARIYQKSRVLLSKACKMLNIKEIYDVGDPLNLDSEIDGIPLVEVGRKPAQEVSELMLNSFAGIAYSNDQKLAKSGVFASYCAHRLVPIITRAQSSLDDEIKINQQFLFPNDRQMVTLESLQAIADNAHQWYNNHNLSKTAEIFAVQLLAPNTHSEFALV